MRSLRLDVVDAADLRIEEAFAIKAANLPASVFKFRAVTKVALRNLVEDTVWLASPVDYNDPLDSAASLSLADLWLDARSSIPAGPAAAVDRHLGDEGWMVLQRAENPSRELSARLVAIDPTIDPDNIRVILDALERLGVNRMREAVSPVLEFVLSSLKLCSLSARNDPILMWSHYADQHRGYCVEYSTADMPTVAQRMPCPVVYREEMFDLTRFHRASQATPQSFNPLYPNLQALIKAPDWRYEEEWRLVFAGGVVPEPRAYAIGRPKAVYLGARMTRTGDEGASNL